MKKTNLIFIALLVFSTTSYSQATFGVKGGVNFANLAVDKDEIDDTNTKLGYIAGIYLQMPLLGFMKIQPEALITLKGAKYEAGELKVKANLNYLDLPVSVVLPIFETGLSIHAGMQPSYLIKAKYEYESPIFGNETVEDDDKDSYSTWDWGLIGGLGLQLEKLRFEARVTRGLKNVEKDRTILSEVFTANDTKNFGFQLTAGLSF